jgi:CRISPR-associated exonuclease Cas4
MYTDDELLPISALQHLLFCERQCALIHIEGVWAENRFTIEGQHLHRKAHQGPSDTRGDALTVRGLSLRSLRLGLVGKADIVEFRPTETEGGARVPLPVEYKRGKPKAHDADRVQLCAQALCLEEMLGLAVPAGALFYGRTRRRRDVVFDAKLRRTTENACERLRALIAGGRTPAAVREPKCDSCSLINLCMPGATTGKGSASRYVFRSLAESLNRVEIAGPT